MRKPGSVRSLEDLGRVRLSRNFFMRDFLYSEIAAFHGAEIRMAEPEQQQLGDEVHAVPLLFPEVRDERDARQAGGCGRHTRSASADGTADGSPRSARPAASVSTWCN